MAEDDEGRLDWPEITMDDRPYDPPKRWSKYISFCS
jgi:hypothetical protein